MIDEAQLLRMIKNCIHLKYKVTGVYAADNFPLSIDQNSFMIVNSDKSNQPGTHWVLLCNRMGDYVFADPLGLPIHLYNHISDRLSYADFNVKEIIKDPLQKPNSNLCGLYCIYIAHYVFSGYYPNIPFIHEEELLRFMHHLSD